MVEVNSAYKHGQYQRNISSRRYRLPAGRTQLVTQIHMLFIWISYEKNNNDDDDNNNITITGRGGGGEE